MGRILETLRQTGHRGAVAEAAPAPHSEPNGAAADEVPFIEVGGRGTTVEGSATVLAKMPEATRFVPHSAPVTQRPEKPIGATIPLSANPLTVAYQPLAVPSLRESASKRLAPSLVAFHQPNHPVSGQYRSLLAGLTGQLPGRDAQVLLLAAPNSGTGTTTVLLNLAITRARQAGKPVVVVDANLRRPAVTERLGLPSGPGLREVAARAIPLSAALQETAQPGLTVLPAGEAATSTGAWLTSESLRAVLQQLRSHFDWVLVDAPSWDGGPEMVALGSVCDAVYLVLRPAEVDSPVVHELGRLIPHLGSCLGGYILTQR
jgi:Mrp family chromosome partitioning ATPase